MKCYVKFKQALYLTIIIQLVFKVIHPTDSKGRLCGTGNLEHRTYLLFFDLTRCLNPAALAHGCLTPQVSCKTLTHRMYILLVMCPCLLQIIIYVTYAVIRCVSKNVQLKH